MSEEQNQTPAGAPTDGVSKKPRLLVGVPTDGSTRPRALAAGGASLGSLKVSMTPQQLAAIEKAKQVQAEAEAAEQARLAAEAKYQEELKAYQEYQAAEQARLEEEARIAAEQQAQVQAEAEALAQQAKEAQAQQNATAESNELAEEAARQLAAAQELMEKAKMMQQQAAAATPTPTPTPSIPMPSIPSPSIPTPTGAPTASPSAFGAPTDPTSAIPGAPTSDVSSALRRPLSPSLTLVKDNSTPLWKNKVVLSICGVIVVGLSVWAYSEHAKNKAIEAENTRYITLIEQGANQDIPILAGVNEADVDLILNRYKTEPKEPNWAAGARTLEKISKATPSLALRILDDITKNPKAYSYDKKRRIIFLLIGGLKPSPEGMREKLLNIFNTSTDDIHNEIIWYMHPLLNDGDIPMLIDIINDPKAEGALARNAENAASKVIARSENKAALIDEIQKQYDAADDIKKNVYIRLMGKTGDATGLEFLKKIVLDEKSSVPSKRNALKGLGKWPNDDAIAVLLQVVETPFGKDEATAGYVMDELYLSLGKPGLAREDAKFKPLLTYLQGLNKGEVEKRKFISSLLNCCKDDQWAIDLLVEFEKDVNNQVSFDAEKALETVKKAENPVTKKEAAKKPKEAEETAELEAPPES